jgi:hypothetical protein
VLRLEGGRGPATDGAARAARPDGGPLAGIVVAAPSVAPARAPVIPAPRRADASRTRRFLVRVSRLLD